MVFKKSVKLCVTIIFYYKHNAGEIGVQSNHQNLGYYTNRNKTNMLIGISGPPCSYSNTSAAMARGLVEKRRGDGDQAPYLGAFHILKASSCKNLSAGIVRFPPFCITRKKKHVK